MEDYEFVLILVVGVVVLLICPLSFHQIPIPDGRGAELAVERHAPHGVVKEAKADVENPLRAAGGAAQLDRHEAHLGLVLKIVHHHGSRPDQHVAEPRGGVDLDHDLRRVVLEELVVDSEDELLVPRRVGVAVLVDTCRQLALRVHPRDGERPHGFGRRVKILRRNQIDLQELERRG